MVPVWLLVNINPKGVAEKVPPKAATVGEGLLVPPKQYELLAYANAEFPAPKIVTTCVSDEGQLPACV